MVSSDTCACGACASSDTACVVRLVRRRLMRAHVVRVHRPTPHASFDSCDVGACARIDSARHRRRRTTAVVSLASGARSAIRCRATSSTSHDSKDVARVWGRSVIPCRATSSTSHDSDDVARARRPPSRPCRSRPGTTSSSPHDSPAPPPPHARRRRGHEDPGVGRSTQGQQQRCTRPTRGSARPPRHASGDGCGTRRRDRPGSRGARGTPGTAGCAWSRPRSWSRRPRHDDRRAATPSASP